MRNRLALLSAATLAAMVGLPVPADAQAQAQAQSQPQTTTRPTYELGLAYQWLRTGEFCAPYDDSQCSQDEPQSFPVGVALDAVRNFGAVGIVGEVSWSHREEDFGSDDPFGDRFDSDVVSAGAGVRFTGRPGRVWPYGQILGGVIANRFSGNIANDDFRDTRVRPMVQAGGGVTFVTGDGWGLFVQADYRRLFLDEDEDFASGRNDVRALVGFRLILD